MSYMNYMYICKQHKHTRLMHARLHKVARHYSLLTLHSFFIHLFALVPHKMQRITCLHGWSMIDTGSSSHKLHGSNDHGPPSVAAPKDM